MPTTVLLPAWATLQKGPAADLAPRPIVDVDAAGMYAAWLGELKEYYAKNMPGEFLEDGKLKPEWKVCLAELVAKPPTAYWLEVAYQCGKMELQICMRTPAFEIRIHDTGHKFAQKAAKPGRGAHMAASPGPPIKTVKGVKTPQPPDRAKGGGREARHHFKRLRGFGPF